MSYSREVMKRTSSMIAKLRLRGKEKRTKKGRITRVAQPVIFTLEDLREWLVGESDYMGGVAWACTYCGKRLTIEEVEPDHRVPLSRGGENTLANLVPACNRDNKTKGELTDEEYIAFREGLRTFPAAAEAYVLKCMRTAGSGFQGHRDKNKPARPAEESDEL